jgi:hypothetical protein
MIAVVLTAMLHPAKNAAEIDASEGAHDDGGDPRAPNSVGLAR